MLLRLPESRLKTHLLMRVDKLKKVDRLQRRSGCDFSCDCRCSVTADTDGHWSSGHGEIRQGWQGIEKSWQRYKISLSKHVPGAQTQITLLQTVLTLTKRAENVEMLVIWQVSVDLLELRSPKAKGGQKGKGGGKGANAAKTCWNCGESGRMSSQYPKKKVHAVEESTTADQAGSQDTIMVGSVGSFFGVGSVSEVTLEPRGADENICSTGAPNVREGESVDIEIDSGAEVSCLPLNIGADTYPLHETTTLRLVAANCMSSVP